MVPLGRSETVMAEILHGGARNEKKEVSPLMTAHLGSNFPLVNMGYAFASLTSRQTCL